MSRAAVEMSHELLRDAGWQIERRTTRASRRRFSRDSYFVYVRPNGDDVYDLAEALRLAFVETRARQGVR